MAKRGQIAGYYSAAVMLYINSAIIKVIPFSGKMPLISACQVSAFLLQNCC